MVGKKYIGKATMGITLLNSENYIIVQSYQKSSVLEIRDITNPLLINTLINYEIAIDDLMIAIPTVAVYSLFSRKTNFYPSMSAVTFSGSETFTIRFYPVDPLSLDKSSELATLIKISTDAAMMPYDSSEPEECQINIQYSDSIFGIFRCFSREIKSRRIHYLINKWNH